MKQFIRGKYKPRAFLRKPCKRCDKMYMPTSKKQKICLDCNKNENGEVVEGRGYRKKSYS